jgi:hypothetical protein
MKCTFFDYDLLKDILGALIGTLTALGIYFLTIRHDRKKHQLVERKLKTEKMIYLENLINSFINHVSGLNESLMSLITKFENDPITFHLPIMPVDETGVILDELLKTESLFIAHTELFGQEKIKNYNNLRNEVSFFLIQSAQIDDMNIRAKNFDFERKKEMSEMIDNIMGILIRVYDINDAIMPKKFKQEIFQFSINFEAKLEDRTDVKFYKNEYLTPLMQMLLEFSREESILQIISMIKRALITFEHIKANNIQHINTLKQIQMKIDELKTLVTKDSNHIKNKEYT